MESSYQNRNAQAFTTGLALCPRLFLLLWVRVNSMETGMLRAPGYNEYPAEFTWPFLSLNGSKYDIEYCVVPLATAM